MDRGSRHARLAGGAGPAARRAEPGAARAPHSANLAAATGGSVTGHATPVTVPPLADRAMKARRASVCPICGCLILRGQQIARCGGVWQHVSHVNARIAARNATTTKETR
jgi:hypothetical protein